MRSQYCLDFHADFAVMQKQRFGLPHKQVAPASTSLILPPPAKLQVGEVMLRHRSRIYFMLLVAEYHDVNPPGYDHNHDRVLDHCRARNPLQMEMCHMCYVRLQGCMFWHQTTDKTDPIPSWWSLRGTRREVPQR